MRSILVLLILVMIGLNGKGQSVTALPDSVLSQCCLEVTLLNGNVTTVDWVFIQYITRDGTGTKLFVEYAPNFGGIQWETQIRIQDDFDGVLERSKFIMLPFTVGSTDYAINRNWIANIEENTTTGGTWVYGRFGTPTKRKFSAVEDYETLKNLLLACRPRAIIVAENGLYTEGDTVRMGGFLIEPTTITTEGYNWQMKDTASTVEFGIDYNTPGSGDTTAYFARRFGVYRQLMTMGRTYWEHRLEDTTGVTDKRGYIINALDSESNPYASIYSQGDNYSSWLLQGSFGNSWTFKDLVINPYYTFSVAMSPYSAVLGASESGTGDPGNGVSVSANGYGIGADEWIGIRTKNVDNGLAHPGQFLQLVDSLSGKVEFATIDLSPYVMYSDTAFMLRRYFREVGFGILATGSHTIRVDTAKVATRYYAGTLVAIPTGRVTVGTGIGITGYANFFWNSTSNFLGVNQINPGARLHISGNQSATSWTTNGIGLRVDAATYNNSSSSGTVPLQVAHSLGSPTFSSNAGTAITRAATLLVKTPIAGPSTNISEAFGIIIASSTDSLNRAAISNTGFFISRTLDGSMAGAFYRQPSSGGGQYFISARDNLNLANDTRAFLGVTGNGVRIERASAPNASLSATSANTIFEIRSKTQASSPFPIQTTIEANAITGVVNNWQWESGVGLRGYNGTRKFYLAESTFAVGTNTYVPYFDVNGQITQSANLSYDGTRLNLGQSGSVGKILYLPEKVIEYGPISAQGALVIKQRWGGAVSNPISIGAVNTDVSAFTTNGMIILGSRNSVYDHTGIIVGNQNTISSPARGIVVGDNNVTSTQSGLHISIGSLITNTAYTNGETASIAMGSTINTNGFYGGGLFGSQIKYYANYQLAFGANSNNTPLWTRDVYFGMGVRNEYNSINSNNGHGPNVSINPSWAGDFTDKNGGNLNINGGIGAGAGTSGDVIIASATPTTTGTTLQTLTNRWWVKGGTGYLGNNSNPAQDLDVTDFLSRDTIFNTNPATHATQSGITVWLSTPQGYALGKATLGANLSYSAGVLSATGSADGNGIYSNSGTLSQYTTRALIPANGNLLFTQRYNSNADSAYLHFVNYGGGERALNFGLTDTSSTGYSRGSFYSDGGGSMNWEFKTEDFNGNTTVKVQDGAFSVGVSQGNISLSAPVDYELQMTGLLRAKQEAYNEITSTSSPQNLSNTYTDNLINQGGTQATFTLVFPGSPEDGQILKLTYNNAISTLTLDGNGNTIVGTTVTTAVPGSQRIFKFYDGIGWIRQN